MPAPITKQTYDKLLQAYREQPGNIAHAARFAGVRWPCAKRAWAGPAWKNRPDQVPIRDFLAAETTRVTSAREEEEAKAAEERRVLAERQEKLRQEAVTADENILRLARNTTLHGIGALAKLAKGVGKLSERIGDALETGVDAQGKALDIKPMEALHIIRSFGSSLNRFTDAAQALVAVDRLREGLPTSLVGVTVTHEVTEEQLEESLGDAARALARARKLKLLKGGKDGTSGA